MNYSKISLTFFAAWFSAIGNKAGAMPSEAVTMAPLSPEDFGPIHLRPLNRPEDNLFAAHRSHSSHRSHASSSGGGGGYSYSTPSPSPSPPSPRRSSPPENSNSLTGDNAYGRPTAPGRAAPVSPEPAAPKLSMKEKRELQIMRVQITLNKLGLYDGPIDGILSDQTKESLKLFQQLKSIPSSGLMTTDTLNALGIPAVQ